MRLEGKVAVITGGTRNIGRGMVERFAEEGARVVFSGRNPQEGNELEKLIRDRGFDATFVRADSSVREDVRGLIETAINNGGRLDVLVNNAAAADFDRPGGVDGEADQPIHLVTDKVIDGLLGVGLYGVLWACRYAVRQMLKQGSGSIINLSSTVSVQGYPGTPLYSVSKGAIDALSRQMACDYGRFGIRTNSLLPGFVPKIGQAHPEGPDKATGALTGSVVTPWIGEPRDLANAALFLASDESQFVTGTVLVCDGGLTTMVGTAMQGWHTMQAEGIEA